MLAGATGHVDTAIVTAVAYVSHSHVHLRNTGSVAELAPQNYPKFQVAKIG